MSFARLRGFRLFFSFFLLALGACARLESDHLTLDPKSFEEQDPVADNDGLPFREWDPSGATSPTTSPTDDGLKVFYHTPEFFDPRNPSLHLVQDPALETGTVWMPQVSANFAPSVDRSLQRVLQYIQKNVPVWTGSVSAKVLPEDPRLWNHWMALRVKHLTFEEEQLENQIYIKEFLFAFPFPNDFLGTLDLRFPFEKKSSSDTEKTSVPTAASPQASNEGARWYLRSKQEQQLWVLKNQNDQKTEMTLIDSPRIGFVKIFRALFSTFHRINISNPAAEANLIRQAAVLFHEARHSDGHEKQAAFVHALCPPGHEYENLAACDDVAHGAYAASGDFLKMAIKNCHECRESETQILQSQLFENLARQVDSSREEKEQSDAAEKIVFTGFQFHNNSSLVDDSGGQKTESSPSRPEVAVESL